MQINKIIIIFGLIGMIFIVGCNTISQEENVWIERYRENMSMSCVWLDMGDYIRSNLSEIPSCNALNVLVNEECDVNYECKEEGEYCICEEKFG